MTPKPSSSAACSVCATKAQSPVQLFRSRRLLWHRRSLRQHHLPISVLFGEDSKESIFSAEGFTVIVPIDRHMFGQDGHVPISVKLDVRLTRVENLERAFGPLQVFKLLGFVQ